MFFAVTRWRTLARQFERSTNRLNHLRLHLRCRTHQMQTIVESLAHQRRVSKNTAGHGHRNDALPGEEAANHHGRQIPQFCARSGKNVSGVVVSRVGCRENRWQQGSEIWRRRGVGCQHKLAAGFHAPKFHDARKQGRRWGIAFVFVAGTQGRRHGGASNPVPGTFIRDRVTPSPGARGLALGVASVRDRPCAGDHDHAGTPTKSSFQGNHHVADDLDFTGNHFRD